jgi:hypothetical protein
MHKAPRRFSKARGLITSPLLSCSGPYPILAMLGFGLNHRMSGPFPIGSYWLDSLFPKQGVREIGLRTQLS